MLTLGHERLKGMRRELVLSTVRAREVELKTAGLEHLALFGSVARHEAAPESDVDLLAAFHPDARVTLLTLSRLKNQISDILGVPVDLLTEGSLKPRVRERAERELVRAF